MAEPATFLLVALSGRALAQAAHRARRRAVVLDLFGDTDTGSHAADCLVVAGDLERGFDAEALVAAAERLAPAGCGLVYGAGFEDRPALLARLAAGRRLYGNTPKTVARIKDPRAFFALLDRRGIPHPAVAFEAPADPAGWLAKRIGASGGGHVAPAAADNAALPDRYYQRRVAGQPIGVSFLADGSRALMLGCSEQWAWPGGDGRSFRFGGAAQPAPIGAAIATALPGLLDAVVGETGLVGLNSLDMMVDGDDFAVIEVNPRPGANLDIFAGIGPAALFELHLRACAGALPPAPPAAARPAAMAIVYADAAIRVPSGIRWPDWVADRPARDSRIDAGAPLCTVLASAPAAAALGPLIDRRIAEVKSWFRPGAASHRVPAAANAGAAVEVAIGG